MFNFNRNRTRKISYGLREFLKIFLITKIVVKILEIILGKNGYKIFFVTRTIEIITIFWEFFVSKKNITKTKEILLIIFYFEQKSYFE